MKTRNSAAFLFMRDTEMTHVPAAFLRVKHCGRFLNIEISSR